MTLDLKPFTNLPSTIDIEALMANLKAPEDADDPGRVLVLSGHWSHRGQVFGLQAVLTVGAGGQLSGPISWRSARLGGLRGNEEVRGRVGAGSVHLDGVRADRGLACDQYRITLAGTGQRGTFEGISWAFGTWGGRMDGTYEFQQRASE